MKKLILVLFIGFIGSQLTFAQTPSAGADKTVNFSNKKWTPAFISTLAWYDANDASTITDTGGAVSQWNDKSGNGYNVTALAGKEPTTGTRTLNGLNVLDFDRAAGDYLQKAGITLPSSGNCAVFIVSQVDATAKDFDGMISMLGASASKDWQFDSMGETNGGNFAGRVNARGIGGTRPDLTGGPHNGPSVYNMNFDYTSSIYNAFVDGAKRTTDVAYTTKLDPSMTLLIMINRGADLSVDGTVAEVIVVEDVTTATRQKIEGYLAHKWGLEANLPASHPYKDAAPVTLWTPSYTSTAAWFDASDTGTITETGGAVSKWNDKSGNGYDLAQATEVRKPVTNANTLNGLNVIDFDSSLLSGVFNPTITDGNGIGIYMVVIPDGPVGVDYTRILSMNYNNGGSELAIQYRDTTIKWYNNEGDSYMGALSSPSAGTPYIFGHVSDGINAGYMKCYKDGSEIGNPPTKDYKNPTLLSLGARDDFNTPTKAQIAEVVIAKKWTSERWLIEGYLAWKWGLEANLPAGHPYQYAPPGTPSVTFSDASGDGAASTTWSVVSGPANSTVTFEDASVVNTTAYFDTPGTYTLRLTENDSGSSNYDDVVINAFPPMLRWDANGTSTGPQDGTGAWLDTGKWWDDSTNIDWVPGSDAGFGNGGTGGAVSLASPTTVDTINFFDFGGTYTLGTTGQNLTINNGITMNAGSDQVRLAGPIILGGDQTWTNNSTIDNLNQSTTDATIDNGGNTLTIDGTNTIMLNRAVISGTGGLIKNGSGLFILGANPNAAHTFSGDMVINEGIMRNFNNLGTGNLTLNGGVLSYYWSSTFNRTLGNGAGQVQILGGDSGFSQNGSTGLTVRFNNNSSYEVVWGSAFFNPSTLILQAADAQNSSNLNFDNPIDLNGADRTIYSSITTGSGAGYARMSRVIRNSQGTAAGLIKTGSGRLDLNAANTYDGGTTVEAGTLKMGNASALGSTSGGLTVNGGTLNVNNYDLTVGNLTGTGGTIVNDGANAKTLTIGSGDGSGGDYQGVIADNTGAAAGTLALTKTGSGTITLSGDNTYTGATTISAGKLFINGDQSATTGDVSVAGGAAIGGTGIIGADTTIDATGKLEFDISTVPGSHDSLEIVAGKALTFSGASELNITTSGGAIPGVYTLVTGGNNIIGSVPGTVNLPTNWNATVSISGNSLLLTVTATEGAYLVTYDGNSNTSGSAPADQIKYKDVTLVLQSNSGTLARTGYTYDGWNTAADGNGTPYAAGGNYTDNSTLSLYAKWTANSYTVTFDGNGGGTPSPTSKSVTFDSAYGPLATVSRTGYTFTGWFTQASGGTEVTSTTIVSNPSNHTLYAHWTSDPYTVNLDQQGGAGGTNSVIATYGSAMPAATAPTRTGYTFGGYFTETEGSGTQYYNADMSSARNWDIDTTPTTLYAKWTVNDYTVTFDANGGNTPSPTSKTVTFDAAYGTLATTSRTGYNFDGWFTAASGGTEVTSTTIVSTASNHTLYAQWTIITYPVTFNGNGNTGGTVPADQTKVQDIDLVLQNNTGNLVKDGYTFVGWNTKADGSGTDYAEGSTYRFNADLTLYARWTDLTTYAVTYDGNGSTGGTVPVDQTKIQDVDLILAGNTGSLVRSGYSFAGWNTAADGSGNDYAEGAVYSVNSNVTLYAKWTTATTYTVSYDGNGNTGGGVPVDQTKVQGSDLTLATNSGSLVKDGFAFTGWNTAADGNGTHYDEGATYSVDADLTLYAEWNGFPVTYDGNGNTGGTAPDTQTKDPGVDITLASNTGDLVKEGYTFTGWNTAADGTGTHYDEGATYATDVALTLYAEWNGYPVTYYRNGNTAGIVPDPQTKLKGIDLTLATNTGAMEKDGYELTGWNTLADGSGVHYDLGGTYTTDAALDLYSEWTKLFKVTFRTDRTAGTSITGEVVQIVTEGSNCTEVTATGPQGWDFVSWTNDGVVYSTANPLTVTNVTENMDLIANFEEHPNNYPQVEDQSFGVDEDAPNGALIGTIEATDADDDPLTFTITAGNNDGVFALDSATGVITVADNSTINFDVIPTYTLTVQVSDGTDAVNCTITIAVSSYVAYGMIFEVKATDVDSPSGGTLTEFIKKPRVIAFYNDPKDDSARKTNIRVHTRVPAADGSSVTQVVCEWTRKVTLYNKKSLRTALRGGTFTSEWLKANPINSLKALLQIVTHLPDGTKFVDDLPRPLRVAPPEIGKVENPDGTTVTDVQNGGVIVVKGNYFGSKAPKVCLEYQSNGKIKTQRLKVQRIFEYDDAKGRENKSCMEVESGVSGIRVEMPDKWWKGWTAGNYDLVIDNGIGLDTTSVSTK